MPYVTKDQAGNITGIFNVAQFDGQEFSEDVELAIPKTYADLRRAEYPPLVDLIDGLVKDDAAQIQAYKDACLAIKAKYPKI